MQEAHRPASAYGFVVELLEVIEPDYFAKLPPAAGVRVEIGAYDGGVTTWDFLEDTYMKMIRTPTIHLMHTRMIRRGDLKSRAA
jgi:hypothetical protein